MTTLLGISGSLRQSSYNTALLRAAAGLVPEGVSLELATLHGIPLYDGDVEASEGIPAAVNALKERIVASDGLILATPEYNHSIPGVFKNAIDWLSRPASDIPRVFNGRPVALIGATPGPGATTQGQAAWLPVLRMLKLQPWFGGRLMLAGASKLFAEDGSLEDAATRDAVTEFLRGYTAFVGALRA